MRAVDLIHAKREGEDVPPEAIRELITAYVAGEVPDYQLAALLMAIFFRGLRPEELAALVEAMMRSGEVFDLAAIPGRKVDKHSTGGVGDKVSLTLAPLVAACGVVVPMVSGRGLGHTGGTLDKLEAIPGLRVDLDGERFRRQLAEVGVAMIGQTERFVPADKKLYALRDVTATVESIPLITASIMSKKLAEGCDALVLDVKTGSGAFMRDADDARLLARTMIDCGKAMGRDVSALLTDMSQPLGRMVGNACETREAIAMLRGEATDDYRELTLALGAEMLLRGGVADDDGDARAQLGRAIDSGAALDVLRRMIAAQGGDPRVADDPALLVVADQTAEVVAPRAGVLARVDCREVGLAAVELGAGRATVDDVIDHAVGIEVLARIGDMVAAGQPLFRVCWRDTRKLERARARLEACVELGEAASPPPLIIERLD